MKKPSWFGFALATIDAARAEGESAGLSGAELLARIDAAYPFGPRANHPYQQWLKARRMRCWDLPGVRPLKKDYPEKRPTPLPGQLTLFTESHQESRK